MQFYACRTVDGVNLHLLPGPMRAGAGYINMNIAADGSRASSARAFLRPPALEHPRYENPLRW
jgi:hypothetical protein